MGIPIEKARKVLKEYRESNFNASKALVKAGYTESMATKQSKVTINSALKKVIEHDMQEIVNSSSPKDKLLQFVGMTADDLSQEYLYIIKQNKDLTNKLKALQPLLATQGIKWNEEQTTVNPTLNLTVSSNKLDNSVKDVAQDVETTTIEAIDMAQQSHETDNVAQYTLSANDVGDSIEGQDIDGQKYEVASGGGDVDCSFISVKEEESHSPKNVENNTIDTPL
jgi:hypothetical protein